MIGRIAHIGLTVSDINTSKKFYGEVLGLKFVGEMLMEGKETDILFGFKNAKAKVAYFNGSDLINTPPVELIEFVESPAQKDIPSLHKTSISELCFYVDDIDKVYTLLLEKGVKFLSEPQFFDSTTYGFGKSKAVYLKDPDGNILEFMQDIND